MDTIVDLAAIEKARKKISSSIKRTTLDLSKSCSSRVGTNIFLKYENLQLTGSFKVRGAMNRISNLTPEERKRGIVASSAGNHAQGVAFSATQLGVKSKIVMPITAPLIKVEATKSYGAEVVLSGDYYDQAYLKARELSEKENLIFVHPYEDADVIAGQGTIGLEILEDLKDVDSVIIPIGGGGLIGGVATAIKSLKKDCKIYGVQSPAAKSMAESLKAGHLIESHEPVMTIADGITVKKPSEKMFTDYIHRLVDDIAVISDDEIAAAMVFLMERSKTIVEGSAAIALAAAFSGKLKLGKNCCVVLSGGNIDLNIISRVIEQGLKRHGRQEKISVAVEDRPGSLGRVATLLAQQKANILQVYHDRGSEGLYLNETALEFLLETSSWDHLSQIRKALESNGCRLL